MTVQRLLLVTCILGFGLLGSGNLIAEPKTTSRSENLRNAWQALNNERYEQAIDHAAMCVNAYRDEADIKQEDLLNEKVPSPPVGKVPRDMAEQVHARGLLNDTAACFYILGEALRSTGKLEDACEAFGHLRSYTYARIYNDDEDIFWDPSVAARARIKKLNREISCR